MFGKEKAFKYDNDCVCIYVIVIYITTVMLITTDVICGGWEGWSFYSGARLLTGCVQIHFKRIFLVYCVQTVYFYL